jgi:hypothetical protein
MKKYILLTIFSVILFSKNIFAQDKITYGFKIGAHNNNPRLLEFKDPFPYYVGDYVTWDNGYRSYGMTEDVFSYRVGIFAQYTLLKEKEYNRIKLNGEFIINRRGYNQWANNIFEKYRIMNTYLDIPLTIVGQPFRHSGLFFETGLVAGFIISKKTEFPATDATSTGFEVRRSRGNTREVNLSAFRIGAGHELKHLDFGIYYQTDKEYKTVELSLRYKLKRPE